MFDLIRADIRRYRQLGGDPEEPAWRSWWMLMGHLGFYSVLIYRYGSWVRRLRIPILKQALTVPYLFLRILQVLLCQANVSSGAVIGPGFVVCKWGGVFVPAIKAGCDLYVATGVVIAYPVRSIGDNVFFSTGSKALGPITIGSNVTIGANAVVTSDVPDNSIVISPNSRIVSRDFFEGKKEVRSEPQGKEGWVRAPI